MNQPDLFNNALACALRDEGIWTANCHANPEWKDAALLALKWCARHNESFIVDRVWTYLPLGFSTSELRAMGSVMRRGVTFRWIQATSEFVPSERATAHRNPRRVWRSRIYRGMAA